MIEEIARALVPPLSLSYSFTIICLPLFFDATIFGIIFS